MRRKEKVLDDIARVAGGTISVFSGFSGQIRDDIRVRAEEMAQRLDLAPRADVERLEAMVQEAREQQADLTARIEKLEKTLAKKK